KLTFLPRPWGLAFYNPLTNPVDGAFFDGPCALSRFKETSGPRAGQPMCVRLLHNTRLFEQGDYAKNPMENSQLGVRYHGLTPFGLEFTLNYFYQRFDGANDAPAWAPVRVLLRDPLNQTKDAKITAHSTKLVQNGTFPAEAYFPYVHTVG